MKDLTISLLTAFLCLSLCLSCGDGNTANIEDQEVDSSNAIGKRNPKDNLSKKEVIARMNKANNNGQGVDPSILEMVKEKKSQGEKIGAGQAEQSSRLYREKHDKVKDLPATPKQKKVAKNICNCLNRNPLFKTIKKAETGKKIIKLAGEGKDKEVKALQDCYNNIMVPAVSKLGEDAGIFSMKSRTHLNAQCLDGTDAFWISLGEYLNRNSPEANIQVNKPKN